MSPQLLWERRPWTTVQKRFKVNVLTTTLQQSEKNAFNRQIKQLVFLSLRFQENVINGRIGYLTKYPSDISDNFVSQLHFLTLCSLVDQTKKYETTKPNFANNFESQIGFTLPRCSKVYTLYDSPNVCSGNKKPSFSNLKLIKKLQRSTMKQNSVHLSCLVSNNTVFVKLTLIKIIAK